MAAVLDEAMHRDDRLLVAVACSLVLHLALLYLLPVLFESSRRARPEPAKLTARLVEPKPQEPPRLAEPAPVSPKPAPRLARPQAPKQVPRAVAPVTPPVLSVPPSPSTPAPVIPAPSPAPTAPPVAAAPASEPASAGPDPGSIAQFRLELIEAARRHRRYPRAAVDNNWEGKVDLRMVVAANGSIASLMVKKSAGFPALDDEAQKMFRTAKNELPIPPALRGKEFTLEVSADFYFVKE